MKRSLVTEIVTGLLILLFIYTSSSKLLDFASFRHVLRRSPLIGSKAEVVAWVIPFVELLVSILLFIPRTRRIGLWSSFVLMLTFTGYIAYMLAFAPHLPCSCGGVIRQMTWKQHLGFNIVYTLIAAAGIWLYKKPSPAQKQQTKKPIMANSIYNNY